MNFIQIESKKIGQLIKQNYKIAPYKMQVSIDVI